MRSARRVVITGLGAVSAAGAGVEPYWRACVDGRSMLRPITRFPVDDLGSPRSGQIPGEAFPAGCEPAAALVLQACAESLAGARLDSGVSSTAGVVVGTCLGGAIAAFDRLRPDAGREPVHRASSGTLGAPAIAVAERHGLSGPVMSVSVACASGTAALALAAQCIRRGQAEVMLAGGVDLLSRFVVSGFWLLRALASDEVRPFDRRRDGLALGEAAGMLILEEREHAIGRGAPVLAELLGWGSSGDANHMTGPSPSGAGAVRAILAALEDAAVARDAVDFVNAHGTGTRFNDRMETIALRRVFGERAGRIPVNSVKPITGHTLGAAGALEAIVCTKVLQEGIVPPTLHYEEADPECDLDYVPHEARRARVRVALSCSSAFAGNNAALLLGAP